MDDQLQGKTGQCWFMPHSCTHIHVVPMLAGAATWCQPAKSHMLAAKNTCWAKHSCDQPKLHNLCLTITHRLHESTMIECVCVRTGGTGWVPTEGSKYLSQWDSPTVKNFNEAIHIKFKQKHFKSVNTFNDKDTEASSEQRTKPQMLGAEGQGSVDNYSANYHWPHNI